MKNNGANINMVSLKYLFMSIAILILVGCGGEEGNLLQQSDAVVITALQVTPQTGRIPVGLNLQLTANAEMSNGKVVDITTSPSVTWKSSDTQVVTVNTTGLVTAVNVGNAIITVSGTNEQNQYFEATASIEVTNAIVVRLQITPPEISIAAGLTTDYTATAILSDNSTSDVTQFTELTWSSSDDRIATISNDPNTKGRATGIIPGVVTISASGYANGEQFSTTAELTISDKIITALQIEPRLGSTPAGLDYTFTAAAIFSDGSTRDVTKEPSLIWSSENSDIATINSGVATGVRAGTTRIQALGVIQGKTISDTTTLTVTDAIITGLDVTPSSVSIAEGLSSRLIATALLSDGKTQNVTKNVLLNWRSDNPSIATVSNSAEEKGIITGIKAGAVTITASGEVDGQQFSTDVQVTVTDAVITQLRITPENPKIPLGPQQQLNAEARFSNNMVLDVTNIDSINWISSDPNIATISSSGANKGMITPVSVGDVDITATIIETTGKQFSTTAKVTITDALVTQLSIEPEMLSLPEGLKKQLNANVKLSNNKIMNVTNSDAISWISSDPSIATVDNNGTKKGTLTAIAEGNATITATFESNGQTFMATSQIEVTIPILKEIALSTSSVNITQYYGAQVKVTAIYDNGKSYDVTEQSTWSTSENLTVINGYVSTNEFIEGKVGNIKALYQDKESAQAEVNMVLANKSLIIGAETAYSDIISSSNFTTLKFQGSAVIDGVYDAVSGELLAGGYGGGDPINYNDQMNIRNVVSIKGVSGTVWAGSNGVDMLQMLEWNDGEDKKIGKSPQGSVSEIPQIDDSIYSVIVYSSSARPPNRYVTGIQFVYR